MATDKYDKLEKLSQLKESGAITPDEFEQEKVKIFNATEPDSRIGEKYMGMDLPTYLVLLQLSTLASFVVPLAGLVLPLLMWLTQRENNEDIDAHGCEVINWVITSVIYAIVSLILCVVLVGFILLPLVLVMVFAYPVIGAIKASNGELWHYPLNIRFIKPYARSS